MKLIAFGNVFTLRHVNEAKILKNHPCKAQTFGLPLIITV